MTNMSGIKRGGKSRGAVHGHRLGVGHADLLGYRDARFLIYLPAYLWVLENRLTAQLQELREAGTHKPLILLDYETNTDLEDLSRPLSHAALIKFYLEDSWPKPEQTGHSCLPTIE